MLKIDDVAWNGAYGTLKKSRVVIILKKWSASVTDEFSSENLILRKRLSSLYTKCVQFWPWPSLLFCTCYAGEMMIPCQIPTFSEFILYWFSISRSFSSLNKTVNDWKTANDVRTCWKLMTSLWMLVWSWNKFKKHWSARVTDEFSSETLILLKRLPSLCTKCVQFSPWPSLRFCTCCAGEMMIPCQVPTFSEFIL